MRVLSIAACVLIQSIAFANAQTKPMTCEDAKKDAYSKNPKAKEYQVTRNVLLACQLEQLEKLNGTMESSLLPPRNIWITEAIPERPTNKSRVPLSSLERVLAVKSSADVILCNEGNDPLLADLDAKISVTIEKDTCDFVTVTKNSMFGTPPNRQTNPTYPPVKVRWTPR